MRKNYKLRNLWNCIGRSFEPFKYGLIVLVLLIASVTNAQTTYQVANEAQLTSAVAIAVDNDIIELIDNIVVSAQVEITKSLTFNGNNFTITVPIPGLAEDGTFAPSPSPFGVFNMIVGGTTITMNNLKVKGGSISSINVGFDVILYLNDLDISNCNASGAAGGIFNSGIIYMTRVKLSRNAASYGGGFVNSGIIYAESCSFLENRSTYYGGGGCENQGTLFMNNCTFSNNKSIEIGGGINNYGGTLWAINCTFTGNVAYGLWSGGAIGNNFGTANAINCLFAYNYVRDGGTPDNPTSFVLDDVGMGTTNLYWSIYHSALGVNDMTSNIQYTGLADGSDNSIVTGGNLSLLTDATGAEIGSAMVYQPFVASGANQTLVVPLKVGGFAATNTGTKTGYTSGTINPVVGYFDGTAWVTLLGLNPEFYEVTTTQDAVVRVDPTKRGAVEVEANNLFMLKILSNANGKTDGATLYGDIYPGGTSVNISAIPDNGYVFTQWDYVLGGAGIASTNNPYSVLVDRNITLSPVFTLSPNFTVTYIGNGNTSGIAPAAVSSPVAISISNQGTLVKDGYTFTNWNTDEFGNGTTYNPADSYSGSNITLYAQWIAPEINVQGSATSIADGNITTSASDDTDFGSISVNSTLAHTFTIQNTGTANLTVSAINTSGANAGLFTIGGITLPATVTPGSSKTFTVTYSPVAVASHTATVNITSNDFDEANYDFAVDGSAVKISQTINFTAFTTPVTYGDATFNLTATGGASGNAVTFASSNTAVATISGNTVTIVGAGSTNITASQLGNANYENAANVIRPLVVNAKALTVTADDISRVYGSSTPAFTFTPSGLVGSDAISSVTYTNSAVNVGTSSIGVSAAVFSTGLATNYSITYTPGTLTITEKALTVTADDISRVYGSSTPAFTFTTSGLLGLDAISSVTYTNSGVNVGTSSIGVSAAVFSTGLATNYSITYTPGTLSITEKAITVTADPNQTKVYGSLDPTFTYTVNAGGLEGTDALGGSLSRDAGTDVGIYAIQKGSLANSNYTITFVGDNFSITAKQLTVSNTVVTTNKMYNGTTAAAVTAKGSLTGVETADISNIDFTVSASYNDASIGIGKTITVVYSLTGTAASNYIVPVSYDISGAKISESLTLSSNFNNISVCENDIINLEYTVLTGIPTEYRIVFSQAAKNEGFSDISYTTLPGIITFSVPASAADGEYTAQLQVRNEIGAESDLYSFSFTIKLSSDYIVAKFDDVVLCDNSSNRFVSYQWYKNDNLIAGATGQFYNDVAGLNGIYSLQVVTNDGKTISSCPKSFALILKKIVELSVYPNPSLPAQNFAVKISNLNVEDLQGAVMNIYNANGGIVYSTKKVELLNQLNLPKGGQYVGVLKTSDGNSYTYKVVVNK